MIPSRPPGASLVRRTMRRGAGGAAGDAEAAQPIARLRGFDGTRIAGDQAVQLANAGVALAQFEQRVALLQLRGGSLVAAGILLQHLVVVLHGRFKVALTILDVSKIELRVAGEIGVGIRLEILGELL